MNLPFVVTNILMVCLSIAGHTTQGYTGCHKHVCLLLGLILVTFKRSGSGMLGQREYVTLGNSMILCSTTDLVPSAVCLPFGASGFKFGSWVDVVVAVVYPALFATLASLCLPSVSLTRPLSPLLSLSSCLQLLLGLVSSSAPPLNALEFYCSEKNAKACGYQRVCQET